MTLGTCLLEEAAKERFQEEEGRSDPSLGFIDGLSVSAVDREEGKRKRESDILEKLSLNLAADPLESAFEARRVDQITPRIPRLSPLLSSLQHPARTPQQNLLLSSLLLLNPISLVASVVKKVCVVATEREKSRESTAERRRT